MDVTAHERLGGLDGNLSLSGTGLAEAEHGGCQPTDRVAVHRPGEPPNQDILASFVELEEKEGITLFVEDRLDRG